MAGAVRLKLESLTDPGGRPVNGDTVLVRQPSASLDALRSGSVAVLTDGVGAGEDGLQAGRLAAELILDTYQHSAIPGTTERLRAALEHANEVLYAQHPAAPATTRATGATALACAVVADRLFVAHVGRERAYLLRGGRLRQLTEDHSWVAEQLRQGALTPQQAASHPRRNVITRCLGVAPTVQIDTTALQLQPGDYVLLCSDGLHRALDDERILGALRRGGAELLARLITETKRAGGTDNVSLVGITVSAAADAEQEALERLALLNRLGRELTLNLDLEATLQSVLAELLTLTGGERAAILLREVDGRLVPRYTHHMDAQREDRSRSIAAEALRTRRPVLIHGESGQDDHPSQSMLAYSLQSVLCVPMIVGEAALGVLYVDSTAGRVTFDEDDLELLIPFAGQAAAAIQNARLHQELLGRTRELELARREQNAIFRSLSSGLIATDGDSRVTHWNPAAEQILGITAATALGNPLLRVVPPQVATWLGGLIAAAGGGSATILAPNQWDGPLGPRPRAVVAATVARIRDAEGRPSGFAIALDDRTDLTLAEEGRQAESAERQRMRQLFSRYLAPSVVEQVLRAPAEVALGGARRDITVLFADVRGFTGFSAEHEPEQVVAMLNQYLGLATAEIFAELGTLDKFIGDAVMAVFGAPLELQHHALAALRAAMAMRARLDELRQTTGVQVGFGIGINSGPAIVGNIGTQQLMSYTAIGDVVNVASRLQSEARSGEILLSEPTYRLVADKVEVEALGPLHVKGRGEPVTTYKVLDWRAQ